jgi:hypothetical protein
MGLILKYLVDESSLTHFMPASVHFEPLGFVDLRRHRRPFLLKSLQAIILIYALFVTLPRTLCGIDDIVCIETGSFYAL